MSFRCPARNLGWCPFPPSPSTELEAYACALRMRPPLFISPLYLEGPKGEGDKGGEGSSVGLGGCPSPQLIKAIPKSHESQFRQCAICPLTLPEHPYYSPCSSNTNPTISRRNQKPREAPRPNERTQRPSPSQRPCSRGPRHKRKSPSPHPTGPRAPFPDPHQAMEGPQY